jgi:Ca-activated chloride channel family protein
MKKIAMIILLSVGLLTVAGASHAAGTLTAVGSTDAPIQIRDHHVRVVINNGFAQTEVVQTFFNPNDRDLEAMYSFPVPKSASLSEVTIWAGERELQGEVVERQKAAEIYEEERDQGHEAGIAAKNSYQSFDFLVWPVRAQDETRVRFVYYQPLEIDTGIGRYVYPLEDGGTDELATQFWLANEKVEGSLSVNLELKSAWPVADVRVPGFESQAVVDETSADHYRVTLDLQQASLDRDFVFYYKLENDLPGRAEVVAYRADPNKPGTFMMVLTPGIDLQPLTGGADYSFVLDTSGSMDSKLHSLARGVKKALGELSPDDRFRIVTFDNRAKRLTRGWLPATPENVQKAIGMVERLHSGGSTNLYDGLALGLEDLDDDRATSVILVTDAVTNTGVIDPKDFRRMMEKYDVRVFGFLMGNSGNWPLMKTICDVSGGFWSEVSNQDDILGQILLAKSKITHEALHDVQVKVSGVEIYDITDEAMGKIYRGEQVVLFGRYEKGGPSRVTLSTRLTGQDRKYTTSFEFPELDTDNPELERLWALNRTEHIEARQQAGLLPAEEAETAILDLGLEYQIVTDYTSMVILSDEAFAARGIERRNRDRTAREHAAQATRAAQPVQNYRVDNSQPMFPDRAPRSGGSSGGGAVDPISGVVALSLVGFSLLGRRRKR